jgi:hypothetical protein
MPILMSFSKLVGLEILARSYTETQKQHYRSFFGSLSTRIFKGSRLRGDGGRRNKKTDSAAFLINRQTRGNLNLLNINRFEVFADDHSNFPPIHSHSRRRTGTSAAANAIHRHERDSQGAAEPAGAR